MIEKTDRLLLPFVQRADPFLARAAIFIIYFWFGLLKVLDTSPASALVIELQSIMMPFFNSHSFIPLFGILEMIIGIMFLIPRLERIAIPMLIVHMTSAFLPLVLLPHLAWQGPLEPTLEGQYILKNIFIIALVFSIASRMKPLYSEEARAEIAAKEAEKPCSKVS